MLQAGVCETASEMRLSARPIRASTAQVPERPRHGRNKRLIRHRHSDFSGFRSYQNGIRCPTIERAERLRSSSWIPARFHQRLLHLPGPSLVARLQGLIVKPLPRRRPHACLPSSWDQLTALAHGLVAARVRKVVEAQGKFQAWP
jgi:hypothetical protein